MLAYRFGRKSTGISAANAACAANQKVSESLLGSARNEYSAAVPGKSEGSPQKGEIYNGPSPQTKKELEATKAALPRQQATLKEQIKEDEERRDALLEEQRDLFLEKVSSGGTIQRSPKRELL